MRKTVKVFALMLAAALVFVAFAACGGNRLSSIEVIADTTVFVEGDVIDADGVTVNATYSDGSSRTVTGWTTDVGPLEIGQQVVTFTYTERGATATATLDITVVAADHVCEFPVEWKSDAQSHFRECSCGARTDEAAHIRAGITVTEEAGCESDGQKQFVCSVCDYVGTESLAALGHNYNIDRADDAEHWQDCARCGEPSEKTAHSLELFVYDLRTIYSDGDIFSLDGATAEVECGECGFVKKIDNSEIRASADVIGANDDGLRVTLTYGDTETSVVISVVEKALIGVRADKAKNKTAYRLGESFAAGKLTLVYNNQTTEDITLTADMVTGFDTDTYGGRTLTVSHGGFECTLDIAVVKALEPSGGFVKIQAEDGEYVDMSGAAAQDAEKEKFESMQTLTSGGIVPNDAEGSCTSNISVKGNKITVRFDALAGGTFTLGMRAQSGSGKGRADQPIEDALALTVNGKPVAIGGVIGKASIGSIDWRDMGEWTLLDDIAGDIELAAGANELVFAFLGETADNMCFPNIDYFIMDIAYNEGLTVEVAGDARIPYGGVYTDGLTLTVKDGDGVLAEAVPVTASMISGLDNMTEGEQTVTVTYFGLTATHKVEVVVSKLTLTLDGGTFADGSTAKDLVYGERIPEITWTTQNIIGWAFDGTVLDNIDGLTMSSTDTTLKAISASDANNIKPATSIRFNKGPTADDTGKTTGSAGDTTATTANVDVFGTGDGTSFKLAVNNADARGLTFKANINFGAGKVYVFVKIINNSSVELKGMVYGTEIGKVNVGDVAGGGSASKGAVISADNANHWTHIFWDGQITSLDFTVAIYTYAVA